jgi:hypothetical protein
VSFLAGLLRIALVAARFSRARLIALRLARERGRALFFYCTGHGRLVLPLVGGSRSRLRRVACRVVGLWSWPGSIGFPVTLARGQGDTPFEFMEGKEGLVFPLVGGSWSRLCRGVGGLVLWRAACLAEAVTLAEFHFALPGHIGPRAGARPFLLL